MIMPRPAAVAPLPHAVLAQLATGADWLGSWWPVAGLGAIATVLILVAVRRGGRTWRSPGRWLAVTGAVLAVLLASGSAVNTVVGYVPNVPAAWWLLTGQRPGPTDAPASIHNTRVITSVTGSSRTRSGGPAVARSVTGPSTPNPAGTGQVTARSVPTPADLRMPASTTWVYTPPGYNPRSATRYPVVYLVHGTPGRSSDWFTGGDVARVMDVLIAQRLVRPMIIVAPDINGAGRADTECLNSTRGGSQVETYLTSVVVPWVDKNYATRADWSHRVIGGMSSGGFCALDQGLRHPELYGSIIALEPYDTPGAGGRAMLRTRAEYDAHSPRRYLPTMTFAHPVPTFLDIGSLGNGGASQTRRTAAQLIARGQTVVSRVEPNQSHNWTMARTGIPYGLIFASSNLPA